MTPSPSGMRVLRSSYGVENFNALPRSCLRWRVFAAPRVSGIAVVRRLCVAPVAGDEPEQPAEGLEHQTGHDQGRLGGVDSPVLGGAAERVAQLRAPGLQRSRPGGPLMRLRASCFVSCVISGFGGTGVVCRKGFVWAEAVALIGDARTF